MKSESILGSSSLHFMLAPWDRSLISCGMQTTRRHRTHLEGGCNEIIKHSSGKQWLKMIPNQNIIRNDQLKWEQMWQLSRKVKSKSKRILLNFNSKRGDQQCKTGLQAKIFPTEFFLIKLTDDKMICVYLYVAAMCVFWDVTGWLRQELYPVCIR